MSTASQEAVWQKLQSSEEGLSQSEALKRHSVHGANTLKLTQMSGLSILVRQFKSPFVYILFIAGVLAVGLGEFIDGGMIFLFIIINAALGFFQEFRSEQAVQLLNRFTTPKASVLRDGKTQEVPTPELVPGDVVQLLPGDIIPADLRLFHAHHLALDESLLTGESEPSSKKTLPVKMSSPAVHEASNIAFSGTTVVSGQGSGVVIATGSQAYLGSIAKLTVETNKVSSFEKGMQSFSHFILKLVSVTLVLVFLANLLIKGGDASLSEMILFVIALSAAVIPEALPLVITFSLSRGAMRLSKHKVVVKRLSAIEDLGGIQILCTDKTGTITENKLTVNEVYGKEKEVLFQAHAAIFHKSLQLDPLDAAIENAYHKTGADTPFNVLSELPFDPERKRSSAIIEQNGKYHLFVRGAADTILPHLTTAPEKSFTEWIEKQEMAGRRVILVAHKNTTESKEYSKKLEEKDLILTGAISLADPLKKSAAAAVQKAKKLGIEIKIITGDSAVVAKHIATEVGLIAPEEEVLTGSQFFALTAKQQEVAAHKVRVFARFSPSQKYQLIEILQQKKEVGFIGDGINDAPALKLANVAVAVEGATDIAREAADVILLNPSLNVIINGIEEGREVFANTIKYIKMTLASNFGNFYAIAIVTLFIPFLPMLPIQILLVNLLSDFPLIAVATDSVDSSEIRQPESYNIKDFAIATTVFGILSSAFDFLFFALFFRISPEVLQTNWFIGSILTELALLYSLRTHLPFFRASVPSKTIIILTILAAATTLAIPFTSFGQNVFRFVAPSSQHLFVIFAVVVVYFILNEVLKLVYYRFLGNRNTRENAIA